ANDDDVKLAKVLRPALDKTASAKSCATSDQVPPAAGRPFGDPPPNPDAEKARRRVNALGVALVIIIGAVPTMKMMTKKSVTAAMIATLAAVAFELNAAAGPI